MRRKRSRNEILEGSEVESTCNHPRNYSGFGRGTGRDTGVNGRCDADVAGWGDAWRGAGVKRYLLWHMARRHCGAPVGGKRGLARLARCQ